MSSGSSVRFAGIPLGGTIGRQSRRRSGGACGWKSSSDSPGGTRREREGVLQARPARAPAKRRSKDRRRGQFRESRRNRLGHRRNGRRIACRSLPEILPVGRRRAGLSLHEEPVSARRVTVRRRGPRTRAKLLRKHEARGPCTARGDREPQGHRGFVRDARRQRGHEHRDEDETTGQGSPFRY